MRILIAAGGTGGHIYPALAVAQSLRTRRADTEIVWVGGHRGFEASIVPAAGHELHRLWLRSLRSVDLSVATALEPVRLGASIPQAIALLARWRPRVLFTTGGYVAIPMLTGAAALRIPAVMWEGNRIAGRSVRVTAPLARAIAVSFGETCRSLPGDCYHTGTPIRSFAGIDRAAARARLRVPADAPLILLFGGSQAVRRLNAAVADALPRLVERVALVHLTGEPAYADALRRREALPEDRRARYRPFPFLRDEMSDALAAADLLVGRAGSSTLAEATALGLPLVVVPYPHASAHQYANAALLAEAGAARVIRDEDFDGTSLLEAARLLEDRDALERMREASLRFGRPGAADAVSELVLALAEGSRLPSRAAIERRSRAAA